MDLHNRWGTAVDPVPFLVVLLTAFATCYSLGPVYLLTFDVPLWTALAASTVVFLATSAMAYYRLVRVYRPVAREEVPVAVRFRRIVLATFATVGVIALLALPLFAR
jgi:uncharacterized protein (DUF58 family)